MRISNSYIYFTRSKFDNNFNSYLLSDMKRRIENEDAKAIFDNLIYSKSKVCQTRKEF